MTDSQCQCQCQRREKFMDKQEKFMDSLYGHEGFHSETPVIFRGWEDNPAFHVVSEWNDGEEGVLRAYQGLFEGCPTWHPVITETTMAGMPALLVSVEIVY